MRIKILALGLICLFLIISCSTENYQASKYPEISSFLKNHKNYGKLISAYEIDAWAMGKRFRVETKKAVYLFYTKDNEVVTVYKYLSNGGRKRIFNK